MEHLDQPLFLLGHSVEDPADGIHGDEAFERASGQFHGLLDDALTELVRDEAVVK